MLVFLLFVTRCWPNGTFSLMRKFSEGDVLFAMKQKPLLCCHGEPDKRCLCFDAPTQSVLTILPSDHSAK